MVSLLINLWTSGVSRTPLDKTIEEVWSRKMFSSGLPTGAVVGAGGWRGVAEKPVWVELRCITYRGKELYKYPAASALDS